jgi:cytochrome c-type biogenesis protein CcmF
VPLLGARWGDHALMNVARSSASTNILAASFALLTMLRDPDFSVVNVFENSRSMKPLIYKSPACGQSRRIDAAVEFILALFGGLVAAFGNNLPLSLRAQCWRCRAGSRRVLSHPAHLNPFLRIASRRRSPPQPGTAGHRARGASAMLYRLCRVLDLVLVRSGRCSKAIDAAWARWVRPWTLVAWIFLTLGIAMGSWAYFELGWGGWWFWDGRECLADALACRHRAAALGGRDGKAQR